MVLRNVMLRLSHVHHSILETSLPELKDSKINSLRARIGRNRS